jgi:hypothetical protein
MKLFSINTKNQNKHIQPQTQPKKNQNKQNNTTQHRSNQPYCIKHNTNSEGDEDDEKKIILPPLQNLETRIFSKRN